MKFISYKSRFYTDEGHGFVCPESVLHFTVKAEEFFGKYLGDRIDRFSPQLSTLA